MAINFPDNPTNGDTFVANNVFYEYFATDNRWKAVNYGSAPVGYTGSRGDTGFTGSQGDIGYTGSQGDIGYTGSRGDIGYTGSRGDTGFTGSQGVGFTGSRGDIEKVVWNSAEIK